MGANPAPTTTSNAHAQFYYLRWKSRASPLSTSGCRPANQPLYTIIRNVQSTADDDGGGGAAVTKAPSNCRPHSSNERCKCERSDMELFGIRQLATGRSNYVYRPTRFGWWCGLSSLSLVIWTENPTAFWWVFYPGFLLVVGRLWAWWKNKEIWFAISRAINIEFLRAVFRVPQQHPGFGSLRFGASN